MSPTPATWRLWLPFPRKFGPTPDAILNGLDISDATYRRFKAVHILVSIVPVFATIAWEDRHHALDVTGKAFLVSLVATVALYYVLAQYIDAVWRGMNSGE